VERWVSNLFRELDSSRRVSSGITNTNPLSFKPLSRIGFIATFTINGEITSDVMFQTSFENWIHRDLWEIINTYRLEMFQTSFENWIHRDKR